ncbi:hypothetical protein [Nocardia sp. NPDC004722]
MFEVGPVDLHVVGASIRTASTDATEAFAQHHTELEDFSGNMLAASRAALASRVDSWRQTVGELTQNSDRHGQDIHTAATAFAVMDRTNATVLREATGTSSLDL